MQDSGGMFYLTPGNNWRMLSNMEELEAVRPHLKNLLYHQSRLEIEKGG